MKGAEDGGSYHSASSGEARRMGLVPEQKRTSAGQAGGALPALLKSDMEIFLEATMPQHAAGRGREGLLGGLLGGERGANSHGGGSSCVYLVVSLEVIIARTMETPQAAGVFGTFGGGLQGSPPPNVSQGLGTPSPPPGLVGTPMTVMSRPVGTGQCAGAAEGWRIAKLAGVGIRGSLNPVWRLVGAGKTCHEWHWRLSIGMVERCSDGGGLAVWSMVDGFTIGETAVEASSTCPWCGWTENWAEGCEHATAEGCGGCSHLDLDEYFV